MLKSTRNPLFVGMTDEAVLNAYREATAKRLELIRSMDDGDCDVENELDALDSHLFALDDELCARDFDLPC